MQAPSQDQKILLYKKLSDCFVLPGQDLVSTVSDLGDLLNLLYPGFAKKGAQLLEALQAVEEEDEIIVDFTRLFIGPYTMAAPPYESIYRKGDGQMMGDSTMAVVGIYRQGGFDLSEDFFDAPDHVAAELEFVCALLGRKMASNQAGDLKDVKLYEDLLKRLMVDHLNSWIPLFAQRVKEKANTEFYRILAEITDRVIQVDTRDLSN